MQLDQQIMFFINNATKHGINIGGLIRLAAAAYDGDPDAPIQIESLFMALSLYKLSLID